MNKLIDAGTVPGLRAVHRSLMHPWLTLTSAFAAPLFTLASGCSQWSAGSIGPERGNTSEEEDG